MNFDLAHATAVLERTPRTLRAMLEGLPDAWVDATEGPDTWSPRIVVAHLQHADRTNWIVRATIIRDADHGRFPPFDPAGQFVTDADWSLVALLDDFDRVRGDNLVLLRSWELGDEDLARTAHHPALGSVTMRELLSAWTAHDLAHIAQVSRVMARQYREAVGPWREFLGIMDRP